MFDVVIVSWNSGEHLSRAAKSVAAHGDGLVSRLIIVDNASTDGSVDAITDLAVSFEILIERSDENLGFARGCNRGAQLGRDKWIVFLNPDAELLPNSLKRISEFICSGAAENVGIIGPQNIDVSGTVSRSSSRFPSMLSFLVDSCGLSKLKPFRHLSQKMSEWDHLSSTYVDQVIGACYVVRREIFELLAGFDEQFFVYFEEVDFALRASLQGYKTYYLANSRVFHYGGGSTENVKGLRLAYSLASRSKYARKHFGLPRAVLVVIIALTVELPARLVRAVVSEKISVNDVLKGYREFLRELSFQR